MTDRLAQSDALRLRLARVIARLDAIVDTARRGAIPPEVATQITTDLSVRITELEAAETAVKRLT